MSEAAQTVAQAPGVSSTAVSWPVIWKTPPEAAQTVTQAPSVFSAVIHVSGTRQRQGASDEKVG